MTKYKVIRDTREHKRKGWIFSTSADCAGTKPQTLETGDYTIEGYETLLCIERKGSITEFAKNITEKRFDRELERMTKFKYAFIMLEFDCDTLIQYPESTNIPLNRRRRIRMNGYCILKRVIEFQLRYPNVHIIFCGRANGKKIASSIFKRVIEHENKRAN